MEEKFADFLGFQPDISTDFPFSNQGGDANIYCNRQCRSIITKRLYIDVKQDVKRKTYCNHIYVDSRSLHCFMDSHVSGSDIVALRFAKKMMLRSVGELSLKTRTTLGGWIVKVERLVNGLIGGWERVLDGLGFVLCARRL